MPQSLAVKPDRSPSLSRALPSGRPRTVLLLWYAAALLPTLLFKYRFVRARYSRSLPVEIGALTGLSAGAARRLGSLLFFGRDFLEVLLLVSALWILGHIVLRIRLRVLVPASLAVLLGVMGLNAIALAEVREFITPEAMAIALSWLKDNPSLIGEFAGARTLLFLLLAAGWSALPVWLAGRFGRAPAAAGAERRPAGWIASASLILACLALYLAVPAFVPAFPATVRGYWMSTIRSLTGITGRRAVQVAELTAGQIANEYASLAWPAGKPAEAPPLVSLPRPGLRPRHVLIVALETAPRKYYPLLDDPELPSFREMSLRAIVSRRHHTTTPYTTWSNYSIITGTYPPRSKSVLGRGALDSDGLGNVLGRLGYETLFLDSYRIDWHGFRYRRILKSLGFTALRDSRDARLPRAQGPFEDTLAVEAESLRRAEEAILGAQGRGHKAFVFISTTLGHYEWRARAGQESLPAGRRIHEIAKAFDGLMGSLLRFLDEHGLREETIVLVTGDHGLRYEAEFASLGEEMALGEAAFNVPLLVFAPGLLNEQVEIPWVTSHVDIAPTLFAMMGIPTGSLILHGGDMLDPRLEDRLTFLLNTGLSPVDGFHWKGRLFSWDGALHAAGVSALSPQDRGRRGDDVAASLADAPGPLRNPGELLERAGRLFDATAARFAARTPEPVR